MDTLCDNHSPTLTLQLHHPTTRLPTVLVLCDYYLPGFKAGGPIKSLSNIVNGLGAELNFQIVTRDRDFGDRRPYAQTASDAYHDGSGARIFYTRPGPARFLTIGKLLAETPYDVLYINSFFSPMFSIWPLLLRRLRPVSLKPLVLAPRGELSQDVRALKKKRKAAFLCFARLLGIHRRVIWHASSLEEEAAIRNLFGASAEIFVAPNLFPSRENAPCVPRHKPAGSIRILFLSRIDETKNLLLALETLRGVSGDVEFNIVGPVCSSGYWSKCRRQIGTLPSNVRVNYLGAVHPESVHQIMHDHDLLFLPTFGENFGHVVPEALAAGCPVLLSDRTPWGDLENHGAGWTLPLRWPEAFREVVQRCADMDTAEFDRIRAAALQYAREYCARTDSLEKTRELFAAALEAGGVAHRQPQNSRLAA